MTNRKQPEVRFKGFTEEWEEKKLGDLSDIVGGGTPSTIQAEYWDGEIDWYTPAEIGEHNYVSCSLRKLTELGIKHSSAKVHPVGTILFTSRAGIGKTAILAKEGATNQGFQSILPKENVLDSYFIFSRTVELKRYGEINGAGSTFVEVSGKQMARMTLMTPIYKEQQKIGTFFKQLDDKITLQERQIELLKEQKKGFLQKMFPKTGEKTPEVRFAGFTEEWEEKKLVEIADKFDNLRVPIASSERVHGNTPYYGANGIQDYVKGFTHEGEYVLIAEDGANNLEEYPVQFVSGQIWVNNHAHVLKGKNGILDNKFLVNAIKRLNIIPFLVGGGRAKLNADIMMKLIIKIPRLQEQQKIGTFFKALDDIISLNEKELALLKETKKGFLQKMFV